MNEHAPSLAVADFVPGALKLCQMSFPANEFDGLRSRFDGRTTDRVREFVRTKGFQEFHGRRTVVRVSVQQSHANLAEIRRDTRFNINRRRRIDILFAEQNFERLSAYRQSSGKHFVEHHPDGVPVAGWCDGLAGSLLG